MINRFKFETRHKTYTVLHRFRSYCIHIVFLFQSRSQTHTWSVITGFSNIPLSPRTFFSLFSSSKAWRFPPPRSSPSMTAICRLPVHRKHYRCSCIRPPFPSLADLCTYREDCDARSVSNAADGGTLKQVDGVVVSTQAVTVRRKRGHHTWTDGWDDTHAPTYIMHSHTRIRIHSHTMHTFTHAHTRLTHAHTRSLTTHTRTHTLTHSHIHLQTYTRTHLQTHEHTRHTHTVAHVGSLAGYNGSNSRETSGRLTRVDGTSPTRAPPNVCATYPAVAAADNKCFLTARRLRVWLTVPPPSSPRSNTDGRPRGAESPRLRLRDPSARSVCETEIWRESRSEQHYTRPFGLIILLFSFAVVLD